jgi:hypothetical protein
MPGPASGRSLLPDFGGGNGSLPAEELADDLDLGEPVRDFLARGFRRV